MLLMLLRSYPLDRGQVGCNQLCRPEFGRRIWCSENRNTPECEGPRVPLMKPTCLAANWLIFKEFLDNNESYSGQFRISQACIYPIDVRGMYSFPLLALEITRTF